MNTHADTSKERGENKSERERYAPTSSFTPQMVADGKTELGTHKLGTQSGSLTWVAETQPLEPSSAPQGLH